MATDITKYALHPPKVVAIAKDAYLTPKNPFPDPVNLPGGSVPSYGQDITFASGRTAPDKKDVGTTTAQVLAAILVTGVLGGTFAPAAIAIARRAELRAVEESRLLDQPRGAPPTSSAQSVSPASRD